MTKALPLALCLALAAPLGALAQGASVPGPGAVPVDRAIQLFDAICSATLGKKFRGAERAMKANGISVPSPMGTPTIYSATEDLSFQIDKAGLSFVQCSMVFGTTDSKRAVQAAFKARFGPFKEAGGMSGTRHPKTGAVVMTNPPDRNGSHTIFHLVMLAE